MVKIKPIDVIAKKFVAKASAAGPDYDAGIRSPSADYATQAKAAEGTYEQGVQAAIGRKAFGKGVSRAGTQKWQNKSLSKGVARYPAGVADAEQEFNAGFGPYASVIAGITLPARRAKGDPSNIARVTAIAKALRDKKTGGAGAGAGA